ncbi:MAG: LysM peptidoglycan-binding domain-containing protein [Tenericutes bacterium]|nr:LysM peptidoglycan-binding domain-containing protein [Mycoplasmatota bacterium]
MYNRATKKVVIDAGHGGNDPGAISGNLKEKDLNLEAAQYMYKRLQELGIPSTIVRNTDKTLERKERINRIMNAYGNSPDIIMISNHINAGGGEGAEIVYALRNNPTLAEMALNNIGEAGQIERKVYQRRLPENPNQDYYFIIRDTGNLESLLVEYGFIDNAKDAYKLQNNLTDYVEGVVKAIADYIGVSYTPPTTDIVEGYYTVKRGDTLYSIANQFNTTVQTIKNLNNLTSNNLQIGQVLLVTEKVYPDVSTYIVEKGDTLYSIATKFSTTVQAIKTLNNLTTNTLLPGQHIYIPTSSEMPTEPTTPEVPTQPFEPDIPYLTYTVQRGDSLWKISRKYEVPVNDIISFNNLSSVNLQIGDELKIPLTSQDNNTASKTYTVKTGDTLWSIAKNFDVSVNNLKAANNLTSNLLSVGQTLTIPQ